MLYRKYPRVSAVNRTATRTFRDKTTTTKPILSFHLILMSTLITERAGARDNKQRRLITLEEQQETFIAVVRK